MALIDPTPGQIVRYDFDGRPVWTEIVAVAGPQAWLGGKRLVTAVTLEHSPNRCLHRGEEVHAYDGDEDFTAADRVPKKIKPLPGTPLYACLRDGALWEWYRAADNGLLPWMPATLDEALDWFAPGGARLFTDRTLAEQYLADSPDARAGDAIGEVVAKTWRSSYERRGGCVRYTCARLLPREV
ncbi:hypothetical protein GCM10010156_73100 [Planobispora rosea]|uniref:Uncharacterized protein n=1 Tax=Planobispora rosea TaxID=35762 RepID=A0A8J3WGX6_PLARO|nr:hypothetical protein [Planobispora rosea]GGT04660.1 hypothetical protein GCM10010156_73100 [Planobispora rosea]GIH88878.1 hypothetical protein Pro02_72860 [Planobispora rosea]